MLLVLTDCRIKVVAELASKCGISNGSVYIMIYEHLEMSEISARWLQINMNMQGRQQRVESSQELLKVYNPEDFHTHLAAGYEIWLHHQVPRY